MISIYGFGVLKGLDPDDLFIGGTSHINTSFYETVLLFMDQSHQSDSG